MGTRSAYDRRIEQLESAVVARGRRLAARRPGTAGPRTIDSAERPLLRDSGGTLTLDARLRRVALHVLAVAEAARLLLRPVDDRPRTPVG